MKPITSPVSQPSRLLSYSSLVLGTTAVVTTHTDAATVLNVNASTYDSGLSNIGTVGFLSVAGPYGFNKSDVSFSGTGVSSPSPVFSRAADTSVVTFAGSAQSIRYNYGTTSANDAQVGSDNWFYAVGAADNTQRVWLQLNFGSGGGSQFSIIKAVIPDTVGELSNAAAAAAAVPEPSALVLLSLGATGLAARRRRSA
jgi:PEP-CTERM motif